ncbi:MAG: (4Fe-4S)-binding protein [Planctomycetes bacterium]|nr:(4Fe-4S)-binding protein [Planctomycetota bacterium]
MKELVIISGKGGTGKTSIVASLAALAEYHVLVDCDVDAADLHLITDPEVQHRESFRSGHEARIRSADCSGCDLCQQLCQFDAVIKEKQNGEAVYRVDPISCEGCGVCVDFCPEGAIDFPECTCGEWFISQTRYGPMVHARLGIAAENSGKLVTLIRKQAAQIAEKNGHNLIIIDGSPGIGCPVIASLTGASLVLIIVEPTMSGLHDLERVVQLTDHFKIPAAVAINKCDINLQVAEQIKDYCDKHPLPVAGQIPYDTNITRAQLSAQSIVEFSDGQTTTEIRHLWQNIKNILFTGQPLI